jgi:RNA polymerase sigma factor (sigma-70 family)
MARSPLSPGHPSASDADLLHAANPSAGLRALYERHLDVVFRYAAIRVGRRGAEDVVAETFAIAFERRAKFEPGSRSALPWLLGIATNVLRSQRRAERRYLAADPAALSSEGRLDHGFEAADDRLDAAAARPLVLSALRQLSVGEREAFLLASLAGLSNTDLSAALHVSPGAASVRLHRARTKLHKLLRPALSIGEEI